MTYGCRLLFAVCRLLSLGEFEDLCDPVLRVVEGTVRHAVQQWRRQAAITSIEAKGVDDGSGGGGSGGGGVDVSILPGCVSGLPGDVLMMDEVVLVGGSSRAIPVQRAVRRALLAEKALSSVSLPPVSAPETSPIPPAPTPLPTPPPPLSLSLAHVTPLDNENQTGDMLEFCSSVDCELAVVQGLAIRGAVLSGREQTTASRLKVICVFECVVVGCVSVVFCLSVYMTHLCYRIGHRSSVTFNNRMYMSLLASLRQDLLMMDMLPTAIGLLVWSKSQGQGQGQDQGGERYFEPVLHKGMRLPCTSRHTFALATGGY